MTQINNADSFVKLSIEDRLNALLNSYNTNNQPYLLDNVLYNVGDQARQSFEQAYGGSDPKRSIQVTYSFPQNQSNLDAMFMINQGALSEDTQYVGNVSGTYDNRSAYDQVTEELPVETDGNNVYFTTSYDIGFIISLRGMSDNCFEAFQDNKIYLKNVDDQVGNTFKVIYSPIIDDPRSDDMQGVELGFTGTESLDIYALSNNINTLRCLRDILIYILLTLRATPDQEDVLALQKIDAEGLSTLDKSTGVSLERPVYSIKFNISYKTDYSASYNIINTINKFNFNLNHTKDRG